MRKRNYRVEIYFTRSELENLTKKVRRTGLSRESFCRHVLNGATVKEAPPADVPMLIQELRRVGNSISEAKTMLDATLLNEALESNRAVEKLVSEAYASESD